MALARVSLMTDEFAGQRLDDLPDAGFSTKREKETSDAIMFLLRAIERDRIWLLSIVIDGPDKFVDLILKQYTGLLVDRQLALTMYHYLAQQAGAFPLEQRDHLLRLNANPLTKYAWADRD